VRRAIRVHERDFGAIIDQLDGLPDDDWNAPVRCVGWQVRDLAVHVAAASRGQSEGLRRAVADTARARLRGLNLAPLAAA